MNVKQASKAGGCARGGRGDRLDTVRGGDREHRGDRAEKFIKKKLFKLKMGSLTDSPERHRVSVTEDREHRGPKVDKEPVEMLEHLIYTYISYE